LASLEENFNRDYAVEFIMTHQSEIKSIVPARFYEEELITSGSTKKKALSCGKEMLDFTAIWCSIRISIAYSRFKKSIGLSNAGGEFPFILNKIIP
jgi:hypothetical protein